MLKLKMIYVGQAGLQGSEFNALRAPARLTSNSFQISLIWSVRRVQELILHAWN
jgi:hypothetical protein